LILFHFQETCYGVQDSGCPFSHFDRHHLTDLLHTEGIDSGQEKILDLATSGQPSLACKFVIQERLKAWLMLCSISW